MKKFFIISSVLFGLFLLFFLIYNFFFQNNAFNGKVPNMAVIAPKAETPTPSAKPSEPRAIEPFTNEAAVSPFFDAKDLALLFLVPDEMMLKEKTVLSGTERTLHTFSFVPKMAVWSPDGGKVLIAESETRWTLYTRETDAAVSLKPGVENPIWTRLGDKIVYKFYNPNTKERTLNVADPDGTNWQVIGDAEFQHLGMQTVPESSLVAYWNLGNAFEKTSLKTMLVVGSEPKEVFSKNFGADYLFAPNGQKAVMSSVVQAGGSDISLALINMNGGNYQNLFIPTLVAKAIWSKNSRVLYYALPGDIPAGSILPNDYVGKPILTRDTFWKVDIGTGEKSRIVETNDIDQDYDASSFTLSADETMLFFVNRRDGKMYRINL